MCSHNKVLVIEHFEGTVERTFEHGVCVQTDHINHRLTRHVQVICQECFQSWHFPRDTVPSHLAYIVFGSREQEVLPYVRSVQEAAFPTARTTGRES